MVLAEVNSCHQDGAHMFEPGDLLDLFKFFRVVAENGTEEIGIQLLWQSPHHFGALVNTTPTLCARMRMSVCK